MTSLPVARSSVASLLILLGAVVTPVRGQTATQPAVIALDRFQPQIDAYLKADSLSRPAPGGIVFVGSSIFRRWSTLADQMAPLPAFNRGFGGSQTIEVLHYMDRIVLPYRPRFVVYYCGSNDINGGKTVADVVAGVRQFHQRLHRELPDSRMFFVSVIRAPQKRDKWPVVDSINTGVREYAATTGNFDFIDVNPALLDASGEVRGALYLSDSLHYQSEAYVLFTNVIKPELQRRWNTR